jgi:hypothetical protein
MPFIYDSDLPVWLFSLKYNDINTVSINSPALSILSSMSMGGNNGSTKQLSSAVTTVAQALEIARDSAEGARNPTVVYILETAITEIWGMIEAAPDSYVMTRDEFAVFNYFQDRFEGLELASAARRRYWDHLELTNGG